MMNAFKFFPSKRRVIFNICGKPGIMRSFLRFMISKTEILGIDTELFVPIQSFFFPKIKMLFRLIGDRFNKILQFHLFKFPASETEIPGSYFIPESFADLGYTEGNFNSGRIQNILKIYKHALGYFAP